MIKIVIGEVEESITEKTLYKQMKSVVSLIGDNTDITVCTNQAHIVELIDTLYDVELEFYLQYGGEKKQIEDIVDVYDYLGGVYDIVNFFMYTKNDLNQQERLEKFNNVVDVFEEKWI